MHRLVGSTIDILFNDALSAILNYGVTRRPRGLECKAIDGPVCLQLTNPRYRVLENAIRDAKQTYMAGEFTWILTGSNDLEQIAFYNERMRLFSDDGKTLWGAYGPHVAKQLPYVIDLLRKDHDSRQAVITMWQPCPTPTKDVPCTVSLTFRINQYGNLDLTTFMRSNDIWLGFPYDFFVFTSIQEVVARSLFVELGSYYHIANDLHLYKDNFIEAQNIVDGHLTNDSSITPKLMSSSLSSIQDELRFFEAVWRQDSHPTSIAGYEKESMDPFINYIQRKLVMRRSDVDQKRALHRD